jgi:hypothetical protein
VGMPNTIQPVGPEYIAAFGSGLKRAGLCPVLKFGIEVLAQELYTKLNVATSHTPNHGLHSDIPYRHNRP